MTFAKPFFADCAHSPLPLEQSVLQSHLSKQEYFLSLKP